MVLLTYRGGFQMKKDSKLANKLIDDSGVNHDIKTTQSTVFVALCRIVSVLLIILGVVAFYVGNF